MAEGSTVEVRGLYRASSHLPIWEVLQVAGIWEKVGIKLVSFEYCDSSSLAEKALFSEEIDFISGNHITPYALFARGYPIVHLASPSNSVRDRVVSRTPIVSLAELRGKRIGETALTGPEGGYAHNRGNHILYLKRAGLEIGEVTWVELAAKMSGEFRRQQLQALREGAIDATFVTGSVEEFQQAGFHVLTLDPLPMINGPTITTTTKRLAKGDGLGERMVKAMVLGIHYAHTHPEQTNSILLGLSQRLGERRVFTYESITRMPSKPYPELPAVANAHELACLQYPEAKQISPLALWDLHYLRRLDDSGFIDQLYRQDPSIAVP